jgi:hypothetical protein
MKKYIIAGLAIGAFAFYVLGIARIATASSPQETNNSGIIRMADTIRLRDSGGLQRNVQTGSTQRGWRTPIPYIPASDMSTFPVMGSTIPAKTGGGQAAFRDLPAAAKK